MHYQQHGFVLAEFAALAPLAHQISYADLVDRICRIIESRPDGRCIHCGLDFNNHDWVDTSKLFNHSDNVGRVMSADTIVRDMICSPPFPVRSGE